MLMDDAVLTRRTIGLRERESRRKIIPHDCGKNRTEKDFPVEPEERMREEFSKAFNRIGFRLNWRENCFDPNVTNKPILFSKASTSAG